MHGEIWGAQILQQWEPCRRTEKAFIHLSQLVSCNRFLIIRFSIQLFFDRALTYPSFFSLLTDIFCFLHAFYVFPFAFPSLINYPLTLCLALKSTGEFFGFFFNIYLPINCSSFSDMINVNSMSNQHRFFDHSVSYYIQGHLDSI